MANGDSDSLGAANVAFTRLILIVFVVRFAQYNSIQSTKENSNHFDTWLSRLGACQGLKPEKC